MDEQLERQKTDLAHADMCQRYRHGLLQCNSRRQIADIGLDINGIEYLSKAVCNSANDPDSPFSPQSLATTFAPYNLGRYVSHQKGYDTSAYVLPPQGQTLAITTDAALVVSFRGAIEIPDGAYVRLYLALSAVDIIGKGRVEVFLHRSSATLSPTLQSSQVSNIM